MVDPIDEISRKRERERERDCNWNDWGSMVVAGEGWVGGGGGRVWVGGSCWIGVWHGLDDGVRLRGGGDNCGGYRTWEC